MLRPPILLIAFTEQLLMPIDSEVKKQMDSALKSAAPRDLHRVLFNLADCYNQTAELALSHISTTSNADYAAPAIMCRSFSIELLLKFFIVADHPQAKTKADIDALGVNLRGHPYSALFDRISEVHQAYIANKYSSTSGTPTSPAEFRQLLISTGDKPFVDWRYVYESASHQYADFGLFTSLANSLGLAAQDITRSITDRVP